MAFALLDGTATPSINEGMSAEQAFEKIRDDVRSRNRIVTSVSVGGKKLDYQDGSGAWTTPIGPECKIEVTSDRAINLSLPLLDRLLEQLPIFAEDHRRVAEACREGQSAIEMSVGLLTNWPRVPEVIEQIIVLHGIALDSPDGREISQPFEALVARLKGMLAEFKETLELGDFVLAADLLEYELAPHAEEWSSAVWKFRDQLQRYAGEST